MTKETLHLFLSHYLSALSEETQQTVAGRRFGFDHVIEQLGVAHGWQVHRTPSHSGIGDTLPKPKKEPEHGIDYAFFSADRTALLIFVLKDEALTYKNFTAERFDTDLRRASQHDLTLPEYSAIKGVRVILAYNKNDDEEGIEEFTRLTKTLGTKVGDHATLEFERWNLERLVTEVEAKLLTPALLPANFFKSLTYVCWQVGDFTHGSNQWEEVLLPDWKELLESLLAGEVTPRSVWMVGVTLPIVRKHGKEEPAFETGWLDLAEWAMIALWRAAKRSKDEAVRKAVTAVWLETYVQDLERFYLRHGDDLGREHSLNTRTEYSFQPVAESYLAFWHLGRLGILWFTVTSLKFADTEEMKKAQGERLAQIAGWMLGLVQANPGAMRPILDVHHVELFLFWQTFYRHGETQIITQWLKDMYEHLLVRRRQSKDPLRLIASDNNWESVFEFIVSGKAPTEGYGRSSYLMLMLLELGFSLPFQNRGEYLKCFYEHLVLGQDSEGQPLGFAESVELAGWAPSKDWEDLVMADGLVRADERGVALMTHNFQQRSRRTTEPLSARIEHFVQQSRQQHPFDVSSRIPFSILALACIKTRSPLPSEYWRQLIFSAPQNPQEIPSSV
ncbi:MAG TPA: hypothetical protein VL357_02500 [Rariglobus sp.]|jgi:hypothetical protein|nr:hypothetical protein [Rariglobus sp.]